MTAAAAGNANADTAAADSNAAATGEAASSRRGGLWRRLLTNRRGVVGFVLLVVIMALSILAPWISPFAPDIGTISARYSPPSFEHPMGTDGFGRDVMSRALWSGRISLSIGISVVVLSILISLLVGVISGLKGGWTDAVLMRSTDAMLVFPTLFLLITIVAVFGNDVWILIVVLALTSWQAGARLLRGEVLAVRNLEYITAARALGASGFRIGMKHIVPAVMPVVIVTATVRVPFTILLEASLSFLGLGVQPPIASWGNMIGDAQSVLTTAWWTAVFPGLFIVATVMAFNLLGDALRDVMDPYMGDGERPGV